MIKKVLKIISIVILVFLFLFVCGFLFGQFHFPYDMIKSGINCVEGEDGYYAFEWSIPKKMLYTGGGVSKVVVNDIENSLEYRYYFIAGTSNRWSLWFNQVYKRDQYVKVNDDGCMWESDYKKSWRYLAIYYLNPDGTAVLLWEHPDAEEIIERTGTELLPPGEYRVIVPHR